MSSEFKNQHQQPTTDISPEKITDLTYLNKPIVLGKQRGRPPRHGHYKPGYYPEEQKVAAAVLYAATGNITESAELAKVAPFAVRKWMGEEWWIQIQEQVHREENAKISAKMTELVVEVLDNMQERVKQGDPVLNKKTGEISKLPIKFRDLASGMNIVAEKRQLLRGEATSRTEKVGPEQFLHDLSEQFKKFARAKQIEGEVISEHINVSDTNLLHSTDNKGEILDEVIQEEAVSSTEEGQEKGEINGRKLGVNS